MRHISFMASIGIMSATMVVAACGPSGSVQLPSNTALQQPEKTQLTGPDLTRAIAGQTFGWIRARDHASGETTFARDGAMAWKRLDVASSGKGAWQVDGEMLCQNFDPTPSWKGGRVCRKIFRSGTTLTTSLNDGGLVTYTPVSGS